MKEETTLREGEKARLVIDVSMTETSITSHSDKEGYLSDLGALVARAQHTLDGIRDDLFSNKLTSNNKQNKQKKGD